MKRCHDFLNQRRFRFPLRVLRNHDPSLVSATRETQFEHTFDVLADSILGAEEVFPFKNG